VQTCVLGGEAKHPKAKSISPSQLVEELQHVLSRFLK
jgi:hypothetical protein